MSLAMLNNVQQTMTQLLPRVVSLGVESLVSLQRITDFLLTNELLPSDKLELKTVNNELVQSHSSPNAAKNNGEQNVCCSIQATNNNSQDKFKLIPRQQIESNSEPVFVECKDVGAQWLKSETKTIDSISFRCEAPGLIIICGQIGSGKSSLFLALLNELSLSQGKACVKGVCGYSSQTAWIFNGTVRDNIIFGIGYDDVRYQKVIDICALERDMELLEYGDFTYIQENSLSGGQKARINLARCLYRDCDIYLLDDPFSAIDGRVANHIFFEAIKGFLKDKLVLLATHQVRFLKESDKILLLDQGKQLAYCSFIELSAKFKKQERDEDGFGSEQLKRLTFLTKVFLMDDGVSNQRGAHDEIRTSGCDNENSSEKKRAVAREKAPEYSIEDERTKISGANKTRFAAGSTAANAANKISITAGAPVLAVSAAKRDGIQLQIEAENGGRLLEPADITTNQASQHDDNLVKTGRDELIVTNCEKSPTSASVHALYGSLIPTATQNKDKISISNAIEATGQPLKQPVATNSSSSATVDCGTVGVGKEENDGALKAEAELERHLMADKVFAEEGRWTMDCKLPSKNSSQLSYRTSKAKYQSEQHCCGESTLR